MSVEQSGVIDVISIDPQSDHVVLAISDHLEWADSARHQEILQKKLNAYLAFAESGEILEKYPKAKGRLIEIKIVSRFTPDAEGYRYLERAKEIIQGAGFIFRHEMFADSYDN